jgi:hypothetical protein
MKMLAEVSIELEAPARKMKLADILTWLGTGLMINQEEDALLEPQSGPVYFQGGRIGEFSVRAAFSTTSAEAKTQQHN